jgi:transcriptional regulator with PAS, ATPase and Fis domain
MAFVGSHNPRLSALWLLDEAQAVRIVASTLRATGGDIKAACKALNIGRTTMHRWIKQYPALRAKLEEIRSPT